MAPSCRRRSELVEEREVRPAAAAARTHDVDLRPSLAGRSGEQTTGTDESAAQRHRAPAASARSRPSSFVYADHVRWRSTVSRAARPRRDRPSVVVEHAGHGLLEPGELAGRDEPAVDVVLEVVAPRDRSRPRDDDGLRARHRLQERRRRTGVGVLAHGQDDDPRAEQAFAHTARTARRSRAARSAGKRAQLPRVVGRRDDPERPLREAARELDEQREVAPRVRADRRRRRR